MIGGMMMRVSKIALRRIPVLLLIESLTPVLTLAIIGISAVIVNLFGISAGSVSAVALSFMMLIVWIIGSAFIYGIMDLSRNFRYSWYLHIAWFSLKTVTLISYSISSLMAGDMAPDTAYISKAEAISDVLSAVHQFSGMAAIYFAMLGMRDVMIKLGDRKTGGSFRKYSYIFLITGIVSAVNDISSVVLGMIFPVTEETPDPWSLSLIAVYGLLNLFTAIVSIPVYLTVRSSCKTIYSKLQNVQEV